MGRKKRTAKPETVDASEVEAEDSLPEVNVVETRRISARDAIKILKAHAKRGDVAFWVALLSMAEQVK